jgi:hypothetical protein
MFDQLLMEATLRERELEARARSSKAAIMRGSDRTHGTARPTRGAAAAAREVYEVLNRWLAPVGARSA